MGDRPAANARAVALFLGALAVAMLAVAVTPRSVALADDSEIGATGGSIYPVKSTDIRMAAETVQAVCFGSFAEYRVDFRFVNDGSARTVKLGFPFTDTASLEHGTERPFGFQAWQNGRALAVRAVPATYSARRSRSGYFLHETVFQHGATTITVSYLSQQSGQALMRRRGAKPGDPGYGMAGSYRYWLHTGSTWKGTIGRAVVRYRLADSFQGRDIGLTADAAAGPEVPVTAPSPWSTPLPRTYAWQFSDFDPVPARTADWWKQQSRSDITLGFAMASRRLSTQATWSGSSSATSYGEKVYGAVQDGLLGTSWMDGAPGPGVGEWLQARFKRPVRLRELRIVPGNNAYDAAFARYGRPRTLRAVFSDGSSTLLLLKDSPTLQRFPVDVTTRSVRFVVESVCLGTEYPAVCVSEVEFGTRRAPGFAPFRRLISDLGAMGRLTAWAGPAAPSPRIASPAADMAEVQDDTSVSGGALIGVDRTTAFPADVAPLKESSSLEALAVRNKDIRLPARGFVGRPTAVDALSYWVYEIRYSSGVDLLVDTRAAGRPGLTLAAELAKETKEMRDSDIAYTDRRNQPFVLRTAGGEMVGVAPRGRIDWGCSDGDEDVETVPAQVFWRGDGAAYHLYARSGRVSADKLFVVARSMIQPGSVVPPRPPAPLWPRWLTLAVALLLATGVAPLAAWFKGRSDVVDDR